MAKKLVHMRGIEGRPLCGEKKLKTGLLVTDIRQNVTCDRCLNFSRPTTHPKNFYKRYRSGRRA